MFCLRSRNIPLARLATALSLIVSISSAVAESSPQNKALEAALQKDLQDYLAQRAAIEHISTLSLTITFRGNPVPINLAVGSVRYGSGPPVTPSNVFQIGSNQKAFTSVLILQLEAAGILSIDDTVGKWLPQYPAWKEVTIRQLLNMTSGIPTYDTTSAQCHDYEMNPHVESTPAQLVNYVYPKTKTPGSQFEYSNTGYILAQMIIDKASRQHSYSADLHDLIASIGLKNTFYEPYFYPPAVTRRLVSGYYVNTDPPVLNKLIGTDTSGYSLGWAQAAGGMISTPQDLGTWVRALFEGGVLNAKQKSELLSLVSVKTGQSIKQTSAADSGGFGLGVFEFTSPQLGRFWGYQGSTIGYRATYTYFPDSGLIICVFTNSQTSNDKNKVNDLLYPTLYATLKRFGKS